MRRYYATLNFAVPEEAEECPGRPSFGMGRAPAWGALLDRPSSVQAWLPHNLAAVNFINSGTVCFRLHNLEDGSKAPQSA